MGAGDEAVTKRSKSSGASRTLCLKQAKSDLNEMNHLVQTVVVLRKEDVVSLSSEEAETKTCVRSLIMNKIRKHTHSTCTLIKLQLFGHLFTVEERQEDEASFFVFLRRKARKLKTHHPNNATMVGTHSLRAVA